MIHSNRNEMLMQSNPYYLLCDGRPLPIAIAEGSAEAIEFRDSWLVGRSQEEMDFCGYEVASQNFVGCCVIENGCRV